MGATQYPFAGVILAWPADSDRDALTVAAIPANEFAASVAVDGPQDRSLRAFIINPSRLKHPLIILGRKWGSR
jgi:hypothetical protein